MYRGTTPTLTFHLPMETAALASAYITFSQSGEVKLGKQLSDCTRSENSLGVTLTQAEKAERIYSEPAEEAAGISMEERLAALEAAVLEMALEG